jgi:hypothetical protein
MKTKNIVLFCGIALLLTMCRPARVSHSNLSAIERRAQQIKAYALQKGYSTQYCFLIDMSLNSGLKRFFVYDLRTNNVAYSGLVAHGSCDELFLKEVKFSNSPGSGCSSTGLYKVGGRYYGQYGKSYRLHGLESSNSNALRRAVVLHAYGCVPDKECYPRPICNSLGCPMVSLKFFEKLSSLIEGSQKPVLLWVYNRSTGFQRKQS